MNKVISLMGFEPTANVAAASVSMSGMNIVEFRTAFEAEVARATKAIAKIETELAKEMAVLEFLDLRYKEVKVSKRVARVPKYARSITK